MKRTLRRLLLVVLATCLAAWLGLLALEKYYYRPDAEFSLIEDGLYMGGLVDEAPPGVTAVLNLCEFQDAYECDVHVHKPIRDNAPAPSLDWLAEQVAFVREQRDAGRTVYVHCFQGASRSGLVVTAYLMREHGWTRDQTIEFVRAPGRNCAPIRRSCACSANGKRHRAEDPT